ncbi:MAG: energy transducer TonB [Gammaproteobacteria bacterium]|nr:MAG: energy transducer TonB [Gammaproteobacteria bacterium]
MNIQMFTLAKPVEKKPISPTPIIKPEPVKKVEIKADLAPPVVKQDFAFKRVDKEKPKPKPVIKKEIVKAVKEVKPIIAKPKTQTTDSKTTPVKQVIASTTLNRNQHVSADNNPSNKKSVPVSDKAYLPLDKQAPNYPKGALRKGLEGDCTVSYTVNSQGHTESAKVLAGCHPLFKRTSLASAKQFRYEPRMINGKAIAVHNVKNTFEYRIQ